MWFLNPIFLLGAAAVAAPLLVHLVRRTRARRVPFPTLYFVRQVPQRTIRRKKLHNLLLLLLRALAVLLIVAAFTRPFLSHESAGEAAQRERATVILLDRSLSLRHGDRFNEAKRRAAAIINEAREGEQIALVAFDRGYEVVSRFTTDAGKLRAALDGLEVGLGGTDYEQALRGADALLSESGGAGFKRIFLVSDFQANGWKTETAASFRLREGTGLAPVDVGTGEVVNLAVTDVEARGVVYGPKYTDRLTARVANYSNAARERLAVDFQINEQTVERRELNLAAGDAAPVEFTNFNLTEGVNRCVITVRGDDFALDNSFYFTLRRLAPVEALAIETAVRGPSESLYLRHALTTGENLPFSLTVKTSGAADPTRLGEYALVILNDVGGISGALGEALARFVENGGRLIIAAGPHTEAADFNGALGQIAPARLTQTIKLARGEGLALSDIKVDHPVFDIFRGGGRLSAARVFGYHRAEPREGASVIARFEDGSPALVEANVGARGGRVLLYTSALDVGWSDLPLTPLYLPFVQQLARYLSERQEAAWHPLGESFVVAPGGAAEPPAVDTPAGARLTERIVTPAGDLLVTGREPGFYRLRYPQAAEYAAVNLDAREADLAKLNIEEFMAQLTSVDPSRAPGAEPAAVRPSNEEVEAGQKIWWPLLVVALLLFVAEALLARRTKMAKMVG